MRVCTLAMVGLVMTAGCDEPTGTIQLGEPEAEAPVDSEPADQNGEPSPADTPPAAEEEPGDESTDPPGADTPDEPEIDPEIARYDGARLVVDAPEPAFVDADGDGLLHLAGRVVDPAGVTLPFEDLVWTRVEGGRELWVGREGDAAIAFGTWTIEVEADLPNGDVLRATIGGVRVQAPRTGVYAGTVDIAATLNGLGVPLTTSCQGSLVFDVEMAGELIDGSGGCELVFLGVNLTFGLEYDFVGEIANPGAAGDVVIDAGFLGVPLAWGGLFRAGDVLAGSFQGFGIGLLGYSLDLTGEFEATRVTVYTNP